MRAARDEDVDDGGSQEDEDEETLKLQLAAIEAKLKLKRLQQSRAKNNTTSDPTSSSSGSQRSSTVQVGLSPIKRSAPVPPRSPGRVLLGIDKGKTGADISLKRAKSMSERPITAPILTRPERSSSRASQLSSRLHAVSSAPKSFSERMAETRDKDRIRDTKRQQTSSSRTASFDVDKTEIEAYQTLAEQTLKSLQPSALVNTQSFSREDIIRAKETATGSKPTKSRITSNLTSQLSLQVSNDKGSKPDSALFEDFSRIHLSSRILPHSFLKRTLPEEQFTTFTVTDLLRDVKSPDYEVPDGVGDYVVFAIIASKSSPLDQKVKAEEQSKGTNDWQRKWEDGSQNQKKFIAMTLTDLKWTVDLYLFGTAVPRYHRLSPGTVIAILNPGIMPPKKGKEDTGAFSLNIHDGDDTILEIGTARHLGYCEAKRKDGRDCGTWVDVTKTTICEFHLNMQLHKTESSRMAINSGSNGFRQQSSNRAPDPNSRRRPPVTWNSRSKDLVDPKTGLKRKDARQFDQLTGEAFYVAPSSAPRAGSNAQPFGVSASRMLDLDDPFIGEGQLSRDKKTQLQKRKERQADERDIAEKLGALASSGAGAEYMRHRTGTSTKKDVGNESSGRISAQAIKGDIMRSRSGMKRPAEGVKLSPVKKTRFVTDKGIREAGRESLGVTNHDADDADDDDDDLDIV